MTSRVRVHQLIGSYSYIINYSLLILIISNLFHSFKLRVEFHNLFVTVFVFFRREERFVLCCRRRRSVLL